MAQLLSLSAVLGCASAPSPAWQANDDVLDAGTACSAHAQPQEEGVVPPSKVLKRVQPLPPPGRERSGYACILVTVSETGQPIQFKVLETNYPAFAQAFVDALRSWRFDPATKDGKPVPFPFLASASFNR
jgi:TonB family protein